MREYSEILGNDPQLIKDTETVGNAREARAQQAQAAQEQDQAGALAANAKVLSETDSQSPNALTDLLGSGASV